MDEWTDELKLFAVLSSVKVLLEKLSQEDGFGLESSEESLKVINDAIAFFLEPKQNNFPETLSMYFAPTGPIQEISISNGWSEIYLKLSEQFDKYEYCLEKKKAL
jgi:hypothetical protein